MVETKTVEAVVAKEVKLTEAIPLPVIDETKEKLLVIEDEIIVLRKWNFKDKTKLRGTAFNVDMSALEHTRPVPKIEIDKVLYWGVILSMKSTSKHPDFFNYPDVKKENLVNGELSDFMDLIQDESLKFNRFNELVFKKK